MYNNQCDENIKVIHSHTKAEVAAGERESNQPSQCLHVPYAHESGYGTDIQHAEAGSAGGAGRLAGQPGLGVGLVLTAAEPLAHAGQTPHGAAVARCAVALIRIITKLHQLHIRGRLHAPYAHLQLLRLDAHAHVRNKNITQLLCENGS